MIAVDSPGTVAPNHRIDDGMASILDRPTHANRIACNGLRINTLEPQISQMAQIERQLLQTKRG